MTISCKHIMGMGELIKNYLADDRSVGKTLRGMKSAKDARPRRGNAPGLQNTNGGEEEAREHQE